MKQLAVVLSFLAVFFLVWGLAVGLAGRRLAVRERLARLNQKARRLPLEDLEKPFFERVILPILQRFSGRLARMMTKDKKALLEKRLLMAGNPFHMTAEQFRAAQYLSAMLGLGTGMLLAAVFRAGPLSMFLGEVSLLLAGFLLPDLLLKWRIKARQEALRKSLPDVIDLLAVSVEAGLGFDAALAKVVEKSKGFIAEEFARVLDEINIGKPRRDALRDMAARNGVDELTVFVGAIIQADMLGVGITNVLRVQSRQMRQLRRQQAEERAMKAPVKMLIPMVVFIFPVIFIILLGPGVIKLIKEFSRIYK
ncbi:type II secretion system F family protein [Desulfofundulus thermosubterraneus]|uniref:Tight adherence protein C n=1 Tax=Desulfofundulus thermosubterraneus DSM 16057 TaxID=1121432 RepID=A0A1M6D8J9_9FIRM|nr:type II secretion system F family protein [Desulfofundulus thermosubterraneus]SHI69480.1 tight adherence protein C [Desulfofundulus thermosubterraneus DSM 16057]